MGTKTNELAQIIFLLGDWIIVPRYALFGQQVAKEIRTRGRLIRLCKYLILRTNEISMKAKNQGSNETHTVT